MKVVVFGGRKYGVPPGPRAPHHNITDYEALLAKRKGEMVTLWRALDIVHSVTPITQIIQGEATGADHIGKLWATSNNVPVRPFPADWSANPRAAGFIRNQRMIDEGKPDLAVEAPGGKGTQDMHRRLVKAGITINTLEHVRKEAA